MKFLDIFKMFFKDELQTTYKNVLLMLNIDGYKNINKTIQKRLSQNNIDNIFKTSYKTLYKRLCWTFYYGLKKSYIVTIIKC